MGHVNLKIFDIMKSSHFNKECLEIIVNSFTIIFARTNKNLYTKGYDPIRKTLNVI